nr:hypothetical protein [Tanacetum cinerariifolium]
GFFILLFLALNYNKTNGMKGRDDEPKLAGGNES